MYMLRPEVLREQDVIEGGDLIEELGNAAAAASGTARKKRQAKSDASHAPRHASVAQYLVHHLCDGTRAALASVARPGKEPRRLTPHQRLDLIHELNHLLLEKDFEAAGCFPSPPGGADENMPAAGVGRRSRSFRNRQLLDSAFPRGIRALPAHRANGSSAPLHVVNVALNLVSGTDAAWQERKAESFTVSPLHSGSARLGYRETWMYGDPRRGVSLGTAMTISGAAVSPNMGYHSSKLIAFLMTLFNVRLGWWLGNPGAAGKDTFRRNHPVLTIQPLAAEAFGLTDDRHRYVYLSDGGHFENLGLYEMVRRRCHVIVLGDGGRDPDCSLEDLGNAVRKIRVDMGIPITFPKGISIYSRTANKSDVGRHCAIGEIDYKAVDGDRANNGVLLYIKPS